MLMSALKSKYRWVRDGLLDLSGSVVCAGRSDALHIGPYLLHQIISSRYPESAVDVVFRIASAAASMPGRPPA